MGKKISYHTQYIYHT